MNVSQSRSGGVQNQISAISSAIIGSSGSSVTSTVTSSVVIGGQSNSVTHSNSVVIGGKSISSTDSETVYVPNFKTTGFTQHSYVSVGAASATLNKETAVIIGTTTVRGGSVTITLPASPVDGQIISFRRTDALVNTFTIAPNAGYTLNVAGAVGNYNLPTNSKIRLILAGTVWYDI